MRTVTPTVSQWNFQKIFKILFLWKGLSFFCSHFSDEMFAVIIRNWCIVMNLIVGAWQYWHSSVCKSSGVKLNGNILIAEHKCGVNLTGLPSGTVFMMRFRNITWIPDSYQGVHYLISQPIHSDLWVIVCWRIGAFWHSALHSSSKFINIVLGQGFESLDDMYKNAAKKAQSIDQRHRPGFK